MGIEQFGGCQRREVNEMGEGGLVKRYKLPVINKSWGKVVLEF